MVRPVRIVLSLLAALALGLFLSAPALAQGGSSGPSAGDNQYIDPLAQAQPKHKLHAKPHRLNLPPTTASSSGPAQPATPTQTATPSSGVVTTPAAAGTGVATTGGAAVVAHKKKTASSHPKKATTLAVTSHKASSTAAASPPPAVSSSSHPGSSFPYVYLIVAICAALGAALLGRHVLLRRAAGRT